MAILINNSNFDEEIVKSKIPVLIDVFATWCGPCKQMMPVFEELSKELAGKCKLVKLNIDEERDLAIQYNVSSIPTFIFIKDGKMVGKETGSMSKETLKSKIQSHLGV